MTAKPRVAIVGAGNLGSALAVSLRRAGYTIAAVIVRSGSDSRWKAAKLAKEVGARSQAPRSRDLRADLIWFCVPDSEIVHAAHALAAEIKWNGKIALHSSGALTSDELSVLRKQGAAVASVHPMMTFVRGSRASLAGVPFAIEGDHIAVSAARQIVHDMRGQAFSIRKADKAAYHAWGTVASPLFTALLATTEEVAAIAGVSRTAAKRRMIPILRQTLANYAAFGAAGAVSGPIVRGDVDTVKKHLRVLRKIPRGRAVYVSLAKAALRYLPARNRRALQKALRSAGK